MQTSVPRCITVKTIAWKEKLGSVDGICVDEGSNLFYVDNSAHCVKVLSLVSGEVHVFAGCAGMEGDSDGHLTLRARFNGPSGISRDASGVMYIADSSNEAIRVIHSNRFHQNGSRDSLASNTSNNSSSSSSASHSLLRSGGSGCGDGYVSTLNITFNSSMLCVQSGTVNTDVSWENPEAVAISPDGSWLWVIESLAIPCAVNLRNFTVGTTPEVPRPFNRLTALALDDKNALLLLRQHALLRYGTPDDSAVHNSKAMVQANEIGRVIAGDEEEDGCMDGSAETSRFSSPEGIAVDGAGTIVIADTGNFRLRLLRPTFDGSSYTVSTLAGCGEEGCADGPALECSFREPRHVAITRNGDVVVVDDHAIRLVSGVGLVPPAAVAPPPHSRLMGDMEQMLFRGELVDVEFHVCSGSCSCEEGPCDAGCVLCTGTSTADPASSSPSHTAQQPSSTQHNTASHPRNVTNAAEAAAAAAARSKPMTASKASEIRRSGSGLGTVELSSVAMSAIFTQGACSQPGVTGVDTEFPLDPTHRDIPVPCRPVTTEVFHAHRAVMAARCPYFRSMFVGWGACTGGQSRIVHVWDTSPEAFRKLLQYIYTGGPALALPLEEGSTVTEELLKLAQQYLLDDLMTQLTAVIVSTLGLSNALYWLLLSHTQQYTELQNAALAFVAERYQEIRYAEDGSAAQLKLYPELLLALMDELTIKHH